MAVLKVLVTENQKGI